MSTNIARTLARQTVILLIGMTCFLISSQSFAQEWTRFRGPNGTGISTAATIPVKWTEKDTNWKITLPGKGHSSPVVWGDTVFLTSGLAETNSWLLLALRASDGHEIWRKELKAVSYTMNGLNSLASGSPCVDTDRVYALFSDTNKTTLMAMGHDGEEAWTTTFPGVASQHGPGNSPVRVGDIVVFSHEIRKSEKGDATQGSWIAVSAKTGDLQWEIKRNNSESISYSTPCVLDENTENARLVFTSFAHGITCVQAATGKILWEAKDALPRRVVSSPVIAGDLLVATCGSGGAGFRLVAIKPGETPTEAYETKGPYAPYVPTPLYTNGLLFTLHDRGNLSCLDAATGKPIWSEKPAGKSFGSPVCVNGKIYYITTTGEVVVVEATRKYNLLGITPLGEPSQATPAISGGRMYLRTESHLISVGGVE